MKPSQWLKVIKLSASIWSLSAQFGELLCPMGYSASDNTSIAPCNQSVPDVLLWMHHTKQETKHTWLRMVYIWLQQLPFIGHWLPLKIRSKWLCVHACAWAHAYKCEHKQWSLSSTSPPDNGNPAGLKNLYSDLTHLTWLMASCILCSYNSINEPINHFLFS